MKTVLVLEGNEQDHGALQALLQDHGYTVTQESGKALQVSKVAQDSERHDGDKHEGAPLATLRSSLYGNLYAVTPAADNTLEVTEPPQGVEQHFLGIYENGPLGIFRSSLPGKLLSINPAGARMLKYDSPGDMIEAINRANIGEALYLDNSHRQEILAEIFVSRDWHVYEEQFRCKDGSVIDCLFHMRAVRDGDGRALELEGFLEDISERKRVERALHFTQFAIDKTIDQAFWIDEKGRFVYANDAACNEMGYSRQELLGMSVVDIDPDHSADVFSRTWQELKRHCSKTFERRFRARDGRIFPVEVRANYLVYEGREYVCYFANDITERKRNDEALKLSQFMIDRASLGIFRGDDDGRILFVNDYWAQNLGYTSEELRSMSFFDIVPNLTPEFWQEHRQKVTASGSNAFESVHRRKDGTEFPVEVTVNYIKYGDEAYRCSFATDITERKQKEEALHFTQFAIDKTIDQAFWMTEDARLFYVNDAACHALGYSREELLQMSIPDIGPTFPAEVFAEYWRELKEKGSVTFETWHRAKSGRVYPVEIRANYVVFDGKEYNCSFATDISERKAVEETLRQASLIVEDSPAVLFRWWAAEGWPVEMASRNVIQFGYTSEELVSETVHFATLMHPKDLDRIVAELQACLCRGEDRVKLEYRIVTKQGDVRWIDSRTAVERDAEGRVSHYQGILMDISDRKRAEEALQDSEHKYRSIVEHAPFGITRSTRDGKLVSVNPALAAILKYDSAQELQETINRSSIQDVLFPQPSQRDPLVEKILSGESWHVFNNRLRCKDDSFVTCRVHSRRILDKNGQTSEFESYQENITDQLAAEEALQESEGKFRVLAETSPVSICIYQGEKILYANPATERLFGYSLEELLRMKFWDWVRKDFQEEVREQGLARLRGEDVPGQYESHVVSKAGEDKCLLVSAGVIEYQGQPTGIASFLDITERKRSEELIKASLAEKEVLLREIHHRVKNNLQVVSSLLYLQSQKLTDPELQSHFLESQSRICSMALAHEQLYQSKSLAEVSVKSYVESLAGQLRQVCQRPEQQIECQTVIDDIVLDIEKVIPCGLLITELLSNAYKHAFADGRSGSITISMKQLGEKLVLSVADDGVGLPAGLDYRHTTTLGLQLVTALTNQLNGTLEVKREGGTLFRVTFADSSACDG
ncbi:MAG: PAS domain S-box protein [Desulfuromonadaceae bacterium]|nr:PAS domain S-box protein [Desulfuromonadaceae bacterium]